MDTIVSGIKVHAEDTVFAGMSEALIAVEIKMCIDKACDDIDEHHTRLPSRYRVGEVYPLTGVTLEADDADSPLNVLYEAQGIRFERIRRITGYLTGNLDSWNNSKRAEERDRVKHGLDGVKGGG